MSKVWLDVHYRDLGFDVLVDDTDSISLMDLYEFMFEDSVKQNVILPKYFSLYVLPPITNRKLELCSDRDMLKMWEWFGHKETIVIYLEEKESPSLVFKGAEDNWQKRIKAMAEKARLEAEKAQADRELEELEPFTVAVEVPVANVDGGEDEYVRVFETPLADEVFPGKSQPKPEQNTQPSSQHCQPTSPLNQPKTSGVRRNMTPRKRKRTPKKKPPPQTTSPG
ncbi:uncharacterized protein LOC110694609 [Chenopodium quinoa]|uniref:uncharacterized protein LOC110694609 n=1 Tax=Chenopodium quinoa TaxID=63459 RepID=UPI000B79A3C3|nr:uncharacterized protein LOC110694609 [Chenopodium quinoa]